MKIVIIDYGSGNIQSVLNSIIHVKKDADVLVTNDASKLDLATHIILPGVGAFADCMSGLKNSPQLIEETKKQILINKKPFLGICVGMQVLASIGYENVVLEGLNLIEGEVKKIPAENGLKVPHMGWNNLVIKQNNHPVLSGIKSGDHVYFANSYHFLLADKNLLLAYVEYGLQITAIIARDNIFATQFHPEKSGEIGLKLIENFLSWKP